MNKGDLIYAIEEAEKNLKKLRQQLLDLQIAEYRSSAAQYKKTKQKREEIGKKISAFLKVGDFVKVTGTRSKVKARKIISVGKYSIVGLHGNPTGTSAVPMITEHGFSKITHVFSDNEWVKAEDFIADASWKPEFSE